MQLSSLRSLDLRISTRRSVGSKTERLCRFLKKLRSKHVPSLRYLCISVCVLSDAGFPTEFKGRWNMVESAVDGTRMTLQKENSNLAVHLYEEIDLWLTYPERRMMWEYVSPGVYREIDCGSGSDSN